MKLRELDIENFGRFRDRQVVLGDGLNLIYGANEAGKSTLHTFIRSMLFGLSRSRGRAAATDTFSRYEPWNDPGRYAGSLKFTAGGRNFILSRSFDKYHKRSRLLCSDDGEELSVEDGDLAVVLEDLTAAEFENTVFVRQNQMAPDGSLAGQFNNYALNLTLTGDGEIDLERACALLKEKQRRQDQRLAELTDEKQAERSRLENEQAFIERELQALETERQALAERIAKRRTAEREAPVKEPHRWRIHPVEIVLFVAFIILALRLLPRPWNFVVSVVVFLLCGINVWNRLKTGRRREPTDAEKMLAEIAPRPEAASLAQLEWEAARLLERQQEKQTQAENLQERLAELAAVSPAFQQAERQKLALQQAEAALRELSRDLKGELALRLQEQTGAILGALTGGKYTRVFLDEALQPAVFYQDRKLELYQLSQGTVGQVYLALRLAVGRQLRGEEFPLLFDDAFVFFDDERLEETLAWLAESGRQVLLLTCQRREEALLKKLGVSYRPIYLH